MVLVDVEGGPFQRYLLQRQRDARMFEPLGEIATGTDNHVLNVGVRMSW